jgi:spore germination protein D
MGRMKQSFVQNYSRCLSKGIGVISLLFIVGLMSSCAPMDKAEASPDYKQTKEMVLDVLQTEDGKKALQEILSDDKLKEKVMLDAPFIKKTIQATLLTPESMDKWKELMSDPEFAKEYAKQIEEEHKKMIKDLMKDPEYRTSMMEILKDPEMEKQFLEVAKSKEFRKQTMTVMKDAMESPYFRLELLKLLSKVAEEAPKKKEEGGGGGGGGS